jgi:AraC-like DNA-binding protein
VAVRRTTEFVSTDLLSSVLRELRFTSAAYRWLEFAAPFDLDFDSPGLRGVHIIAEGRCDLVLRDAPATTLTAGDVVILPRGDAHVLRSPPAEGDGMRTVVVCGAFVVGEPDHPALLGLPAVLRLPGVDGRPPAWVATLVDALREEALHGGPGSDLVMARLSDALLIRALRQHSATVDQPGWLAGLGDPCVAAALAAMHRDLAHPWTLPALAAVAGLSRAAFAARFTARVGRPAMRYLLALRMQRARTLLRDERATVAAVATRIGYATDVAFAAAFKREVGTSPGAYRRAG